MRPLAMPSLVSLSSASNTYMPRQRQALGAIVRMARTCGEQHSKGRMHARGADGEHFEPFGYSCCNETSDDHSL